MCKISCYSCTVPRVKSGLPVGGGCRALPVCVREPRENAAELYKKHASGMLALSGSALAETPALPSALSKGARGALELSVLQELRKGMQGRSGRNGAPPAFDVGLAPPSSALV